MDFPVCPACGQSVIDDDVEDCPFCGSSMTAKPGAKPAAPKPTAAASAKPGAAPSKPGAAASKPTTPGKATPGKATPASKTAGAKPGAADDFPFDADLPAGKSALQAMPNETKQRSLKVICPMCETAGYVPPTAAGQEVKCANPKCLVPVFKAPVPVVEAPPPPPPKSNLVPILGVTAVVVVVAGLGIFVLPGLLASKPKPSGPSDEAKAMMAEMAKGNSATPKNSKTDTSTNQTPTTSGTTKNVETKSGTAPKSTEDLIADTLKQLGEACLVDGRPQRSKPYCRQLAAEASVLTGDMTAANEHLKQLEVVGRDVLYYRIVPNLDLFWRELAAGDRAAANRSLKVALDEAPKIPKVGRNQLEIAGRLAAALAAGGRIPDALSVLQGHQSAEPDGQLAARVQMATDGSLARLTNARAVLPWSAPQAVAATATLVARGQSKAAHDWAVAQPNDDAKAECLAIWAEGVARGQAQPGSADSNAEIVEAVKSLAPPLAARVWARAACGRFAAKDAAGTAATLKLARDLLATVAVPSEPIMPEVKQTAKYTVPAAAPLVRAATAAAEIAFVQSLSTDSWKDADASLDQALQFARGLAPGWSAASQRSNEAEQLGANGLGGLLKGELKLKTDDEARLAVSKYRASLKDITEASRQRFDLQTKILTRMAQAGLKDKVWTIVSSRDAESNASLRDDFLATPLAGELLELFHGTETEKAIQGALSAGGAPKRPDLVTLGELLLKGDAQGAAEFVSALDSKSGRRDELTLTLASSLATAGKLETAMQFIGRLEDIVLREEAYRLTAGLAAQRGQVETITKQIALASQATERAALCRGLIGGLKQPATESPPEPSAAP